MANEEHLAILRQGVDVWNAWRAEHPDVQPDLGKADYRAGRLRGADLHGVDLSGADLITADLSGANLTQADLTTADLSRANLIAADLSGANLTQAELTRAILAAADLTGAHLNGVDLTRADLRGSHLRGANLHGSILRGADLSGADLSRAVLYDTVFSDNDLSDSKGLATIEHLGPSYISTDTLIKSQGKIPESFLRGCGVPQSFIEYLPALLGAMQPAQFYSCFISYSTKDEEFAKRLHSKMRDINLRVWFANEDLKGGYKIHDQIDEAIRVYDKAIIVLSPESLRSKWVMNEVRKTRKAELATNKRKFFPIGLLPYKELEGWECLDSETGTDLAREIREYYIPDFSHWKDHDSFEREFAKLLNALKATEAPPIPRAAPKPKPKDMPQEPEIVITAKKRRLGKLEEQQAKMGISTPPEVVTEIEDLRAEISRLEHL